MQQSHYESHPDQMIRAKQINITKEKPELIQIADFLAYSFAKAKTVQEYKNKDFFIEIIKTLNPAIAKKLSTLSFCNFLYPFRSDRIALLNSKFVLIFCYVFTEKF